MIQIRKIGSKTSIHFLVNLVLAQLKVWQQRNQLTSDAQLYSSNTMFYEENLSLKYYILATI